ncbi:MAG: LuxR C-terminal-related transcriptional regulator [Acidimicrobiales bacterium]
MTEARGPDAAPTPGATVVPHRQRCSEGEVPGVRPGVVARDRLVGRLRRSASGSLVVVAAPAGYGKTTTVALWAQADERPFAWSRARPTRRRPRPPPAAPGVRRRLGRRPGPRPSPPPGLPGRSVADELLPAVVARLAVAPRVVLVFDDVQALGSEAARSCLTTLVDELGPHLLPVLIGRSIAAVPLARRRLDGTVVEIGPGELALSVDEAQRALAHQGVALDRTTTEGLVARVEGWAAGLHLAALAAREPRSPTAPVLTGRHRLVADYLVEEVLRGLDPAVTAFLEDSAVVERMDADLLDDLLERDDSATRLQALEDSGNLFLVPLDDERRWYRYHHLFAELLRDRLRRRDPGRARYLHRQAADRFEAVGDLDTAIAHAVDAGDEERAAALVMREAVALAFDGRSGVLARRLALLGDGAADRWVDAAVATAWYGLSVPDPALIHRSAQQAAGLDDGRRLGDGTPSAGVAIALQRSLLAVGGIPGILRDTATVIDSGGWTTNPWWGMATAIRATALANIGELTEARRLLADALPAVGSLPGMEAGSHAWMALLDLSTGDVESARQHVEASRRIADRHDLEGLVATMVTYSVDALVAARAGDLTRAERAVAVTEVLLERLGDISPRTALLNHAVIAQACLALGDGHGARRHVRDAQRAADREPTATWLIAQLHDVEAQVDAVAASTSLVTPLTEAELRVLPHLATHLSLQEIAGELHVSRNTAKTHSVAIYRKLGVSSRSDAVAEARRLGLLPG